MNYVIKDGNGALQTVNALNIGGNIGPASTQVDVTGTPIGTPANPVYMQQPSGLVSPGSASASEVVTGDSAVVVVAGPINGGYLTNPINDAAQGVTAENLYVDPVATPGSTDASANGTTSMLLPGQSYTIPALAAGKTLKANAATSGHKFTVVVW